MKKTITIIAIAALFVSCAKEAEQTPAASGNVVTVAPTEFSATLETPEPDTKTTLDGDKGKTVLWEEGDAISVWPGVLTQAKYTLSSGAGTNSATFTSDQTVTGNPMTFNVALYPYDADVVLTEDLVFENMTYPAVQNYREDSWGKGAMPMFGNSMDTEDNSISFQNLAGVLRLTLTGTATIDSIRVSALGENEYVSGVFYKTLNSLPGGTAFTSGEKTVTLKCGTSGVKLSETEGTVFNIVIPPITGGFKVAICDRNHEVMILQSKSEIKRNTILNMPAVEYAPNAMDLGLSVYWATCNVGATTPDGYGDYFAWGETEPYYEDGHAYDKPCTDWKDGKSSGYAWDSYKWCDKPVSDSPEFNKYNDTDGKTVLEAADDAATAKWGSAWRMPTESEMNELKDDCAWTWTTQNSVNGYKVVSKKEGYEGESIFLPAAGYRDGDSLYVVGSRGYYWSSSLNWANTSRASFLYFSGSNASMHYTNYRYYGHSVRPVTEK